MKRLEALTLLNLTWTVLLATACGLGTEIGNGFKSGREDGKDGAKKQSASSPEPAQQDDMAGGATGGTDGGEGPEGVSAEPPLEENDNAGDGRTPDASLDADALAVLITVECSSPFHEDALPSPLKLALKGSQDPVLVVTREGVTPWRTVADAAGKVLARVARDPAGGAPAVEATLPDGTPMAQKFRCDSTAGARTDGSSSTREEGAAGLVDDTGAMIGISWSITLPFGATPVLDHFTIETDTHKTVLVPVQ